MSLKGLSDQEFFQKRTFYEERKMKKKKKTTCRVHCIRNRWVAEISASVVWRGISKDQ